MKQIITTPSGERMIVLPEAEYERLLETLEDLEGAAAVRSFEEKLAAGEEELIRVAMVERLLGGENPITVWREYRGLSAKALAEAAGITQPYLSQIESGKRDGTVSTMKRIAEALRVSLDDIV